MVPKSQNLPRFTWKFPHQSIWRCWARVWHWYFKILYLKSIFRQIGHKLDKLVLRLKSHRIYLKFCSRVNIWKCLQWIWRHYFDIIHLKHKFGQIGPKIKASLNLLEYSHTIQLEDSKCKYDNKRIFKFKSKFEKMFIQYSASGRSVSKCSF